MMAEKVGRNTITHLTATGQCHCEGGDAEEAGDDVECMAHRGGVSGHSLFALFS